MRRYRKFLYFLLSCVVVLALSCRFEICVGGFADAALLNGLDKLRGAFREADYADLLMLAAVMWMFGAVEARDRKFDVGTGLLSFVFAVLLVVCISFRKFNSAVFLLGNSFQILLSLCCIAGFWILLYLALRLVFLFFEKERPSQEMPAERTAGQGSSYFGVFGFFVILAGWLPWLLMNYPGTSCPDGILQLKQFLGDAEWGAAHPPLSTAVMGSLFWVGRSLADANFGFFLYCLFQTCAGAWVFSFSMRKLQQLGIPVKWCVAGLFFFAFSSFWGTYAQWFEKDLLYAEATVLQAVYLLEVIRTRRCDVKNTLLLTLSGLLAALLRNNGIYAVVPALLLAAVWLKGRERKRMAAAFLATLLLYEGITGGLYGVLLGISKPSAAEAFSIPFQQTARYVCEYGDEVTDYEREVIDSVLDYDAMTDYNPVISDPIKIHYKGGELSEYSKVWFQMFWKHPGCYVAAFLNKGYGYLAPVSQNIEAWIQLEYPDYIRNLGIYHAFGLESSHFLVQIWNLSMTLPLVKYLCTPGIYTWLLAALAALLWRHRKFGALILFVPSFMNVLVCLASPLADAIRYELPTVAVMPLLIGWTYDSLRYRSAWLHCNE